MRLKKEEKYIEARGERRPGLFFRKEFCIWICFAYLCRMRNAQKRGGKINVKKFRMMLAGAVVAVMVASGSNVGWVQQTEVQAATGLSQVPGYTGNPYTVVNDNEPDFAESDFTTDAFEITNAPVSM